MRPALSSADELHAELTSPVAERMSQDLTVMSAARVRSASH